MKPAKKPYYTICEACGAHLDPGETCDCMNKQTLTCEGLKHGRRHLIEHLINKPYERTVQ